MPCSMPSSYSAWAIHGAASRAWLSRSTAGSTAPRPNGRRAAPHCGSTSAWRMSRISRQISSVGLRRTTRVRTGAPQCGQSPPTSRPSASAHAVGVPTAPAHAGETSQVCGDRPPGLPLVGSDASLGFRDLSLQVGDGFFRLAGRTGDLANGKPRGFQGLHGVTVLLELNPVPGDVALVVRNHAGAVPDDRLGLLFECLKWAALVNNW